MTEAVRLVIWDLDETFWKGTITEGGVQEDSHFGHIVEALAKRGIISSICSKNDFDRAREVLERMGVWQYFVFPSINWEPKGARIAHIVEQVQLRAPTILFIDDNPMNLEEAKFVVPGLQVADETIIPTMLDNPLFAGKDDPSMKRLADYRLLETKSEAQEAIGGDTHAFLRDSRICVELEYDIEKHIDRVIELINRTNQLNFTKIRLPDDQEAARAEVRAMTEGYDCHTGLVRVRDRFGDYGYVGFFLQRKGAGYNSLQHFCFSCRTLGMSVETWIYRQLGRPELTVQGEVISDIFDESNPCDWISYYQEGQDDAQAEIAGEGGILLCGGCDLEAVAHYVQPVTRNFRLFANTIRHGGEIRRDHSTIVACSAAPLPQGVSDCLEQSGYTQDDLSLDYASGAYSLVVFSFWGDLYYRTYRQYGGDAVLTYTPSNLGYNDVLSFYEPDLRGRGVPDSGIAAFRYAKANLIHNGPSDEKLFLGNLRRILSAIPPTTQIVLLAATERQLEPAILQRHRTFNGWLEAAWREFDNVAVLPIETFIEDDAEQVTSTHFTRPVYQRLAARLKSYYREIERQAAQTTMTAETTETVAAE
jgi:FkbH-like protein